MRISQRLVAVTLAALLALGAAACRVDDFEGDPLEDDLMDERLNDPTGMLDDPAAEL